jgi:hypothetical protein
LSGTPCWIKLWTRPRWRRLGGKPGLKPLNGALGGTRPPEQRLLFEYAVRTHPEIRTLVVGFYDFQITEPDRTQVADLVGNRMVGIDRRFPISEVSSVYGFGPLDTMEIEALRLLPMAANRGNALAYVEMMRRWRYVEQLRRSMESMGMLHVDPNRNAGADGIPVIESADVDKFDASARSFIEHPDRFNTSYEAIFDEASSTGMSVVILVAHIALPPDNLLFPPHLAGIRQGPCQSGSPAQHSIHRRKRLAASAGGF